MKIAFFTEANFTGKYPRNYPNARTDVAWQIALDAEHFHLHAAKIPKDGSVYFNLGIIIVPKKLPGVAFDSFDSIKAICDRVAVMQEGPNWFWQDWPVPTQFEYLQFLKACDIIYTHNTGDQRYYKGLVEHDDVRILSTLMVEDSLNEKMITPMDSRWGIMLGGNFVSWYGGMDSFVVSSQFTRHETQGQYPIYAPSMGRKQEYEDKIGAINYLPYLRWDQWIYELSKRKYAIHLMRTHAAGTFALNCAYLGIPCIGYRGLNTQGICHPYTTVPMGRLDIAKQVAERLRTDEDFYEQCALNAQVQYQNVFAESVFLKNIDLS